MILPIRNEDKKVISQEDMVVKIKLIGEYTEQGLTKNLRGLEVISS